MAEETAVEAPVVPPTYVESAKSVFRQQRIEAGLDKPAEPASEPTPEPTTEKKTDVATPDSPASVLPDDVLSPEPKEEPTPSSTIAELEAMTLPSNAKKEKVVAFEGLKKKAIADLTASEKRIQELEQKLSSATTHVEIESLREKLKAAEQKAMEIEEQFSRAAFEHSPRFQQQFVAAEKSALESAKSYLEGSEIDPRIIEFAAHNVGKRRLEILADSGMDEKMIAAVTSHLADYDRVQRDKSQAVENWKSEAQKWQEDEQKRMESEVIRRREFENKTWETVLAKNANELLPFRASKNETWNSRAETLKLQAKENFERTFNGEGVPLEVSADAYQKQVAYDVLVKEVVNPLIEKNKLLEAENAKLRSSAPGGTITQTNGQVTKVDPSKIDRTELSKQTFNEQLAATRRS